MTEWSDRGPDALPLPEFDHLPVESIGARIRSLDEQQLEQLIQYERAHAGRTQILQVLERRRDEVRQGAPQTEGDPAGRQPETAAPPASGSPVGPEEGPAINPPTGGVPTNPAQPRR